jgi:hypothetical protein
VKSLPSKQRILKKKRKKAKERKGEKGREKRGETSYEEAPCFKRRKEKKG